VYFLFSYKGVSSVISNNQNPDKLFENHYKYLKRIIEDVIQIDSRNQDELNYCIYLLDRDYLPLNDHDDIVRNCFKLF
jgi:hypothetical protein